MDKRWLILIPVILVTVLWWTTRNQNHFDFMLYRGEKIKLSRQYANFDQYKNDPNNIDPSETKRVQSLVMTAPIAHSFASWSEFFRAEQAAAFPGYGTSIFPGRRSDGNDLTLVTIEVPRADKDRFIVVQERNGQCEVLDDFVYEDVPEAFGVHRDSDSYVFVSRNGKEIFRRPENGRSGG